MIMEKYLPEEYVLKFNNRPGNYTVVKVIGKGTSTVAYRAKYTDQDGLVSFHILKEYNPCYVNLTRDDDGTMICSESDRNKFDTGLSKFTSGYKRQSELRNIEKMTNQTPPIQGIFEANNTKYMDVSCYTGKTYDDLNELNLFKRMKICLSVAKLVQYYHQSGYLCLDIKPENIFVLDGITEMVEFIDFDSVCLKSEITFGNSLSYTKSWAAPEQINPGGWSEISEASDIYTVGELIFWSVFERHSLVQEHRHFSSYNFEKCVYSQDMSSYVQMLFTDIFHNSLRSSAENRYSSMDKLITTLNKLVNELSPNKKYIVNSNVHLKEFFIGRETEMAEIEIHLREKKLVFLSGIGGIGKSEIAKHYQAAHKDEYRNVLYMTYEGNLETMICQEDSVAIANFDRSRYETDHNYCWRKLSKIKELLEGENLIIIDNLDVQIENINHPDIWKYLLTLPCNILITTRCKQAEYTNIFIRELSGIGFLKSIFAHYCPFAIEHTVHVEEIIERLNKHTLLVVLIANQIKAAFLTPLAMNERLRESGIFSFNQVNVTLLKDGSSKNFPVAEHIQKIFSMSSMSLERQFMLIRLVFMPLNGVRANVFNSFYSFNNLNDLNWLIKNGWVNCTDTENRFLSVHPVIASVVVDILKKDFKLQESLYNGALHAMKKGYDDRNENQNTYEWFITRPTTNGEYESRKKVYKEAFGKTDINQKDYVAICDAIANLIEKYSMQGKMASKYITQYVDWFIKYGNTERKIELLEYTIKTYRSVGSANVFDPDSEKAWDLYACLLMNNGKIDASIKIAQEHMKVSKKAKDWYWVGCWCANLTRLYFEKLEKPDYNQLIKYYALLLFNSIRVRRRSKKSFPKFERVLNKQGKAHYEFLYYLGKEKLLYTRWAYVNEMISDLGPAKLRPISISLLSYAINLRGYSKTENSLEPTNNSIVIRIDKAKISIRKQRYKEAKEILQQIIEMYETEKLKETIGLYMVHEILGDIALLEENYKIAEEEFDTCLEINKVIDSQDEYSIKIKKGYLYNKKADLIRSEKLNLEVLSELKSIDSKSKRHLLGDAYYNVGDMYMLKGDYDMAWEYFEIAALTYVKATRFRTHINIGCARCVEKSAAINMSRGLSKDAIEQLEFVMDTFKQMLGINHPETRACKEKLDRYKSNCI
jgi:serine/threonine protein kinase/tetratricopeptide (TPR) repeat protein